MDMGGGVKVGDVSARFDDICVVGGDGGGGGDGHIFVIGMIRARAIRRVLSGTAPTGPSLGR